MTRSRRGKRASQSAAMATAKAPTQPVMSTGSARPRGPDGEKNPDDAYAQPSHASQGR